MSKNTKNLKIADVVSKTTGKGWVYSEIVKDHFFHPRNLLLKDPKPGEFDAEGQIGSPACGDVMRMWLKIDPKTERIKKLKWRTFGCLFPGQLVYSPENFQPIETYKKNDSVFSGSGKICRVLIPQKREYAGKIITITPLISRLNKIKVTPEHPIYCLQRKKLKGTRGQSHTKFWRVDPRIFISAKPQYLPAGRLEIGDYLVYRYPLIEKDQPELTEKAVKLLGYYLSEGYFSAGDQKGEYGILAFAFNKNEKILIRDVKTLLYSLFQKRAKERTRGSVTEVYICSRKAIRFCEKYCGHHASKKKLHPDLLLLPIKKQKILFNSYFKGDGNLHRDKRGNRADTFNCSTSSLILAYQLQMIIARLGYFAKIRDRRSSAIIDGRKIKDNLRYTVSFIKRPSFRSIVKQGNKCFYIPIGKIQSKDYQGKVYNLTVNSPNPSYLANGFVVHNCGSAIATTSIFSVMVTENGGMKIDEALKIRPQDIMKRLGGLPARKVHCSVLADKAFRKTINNYFRKTGQHHRVIIEGQRVIDPKINLTDRDIEEAVLEGARTIEDLQKRLKVGIGNPEVVPEIEQLLRFYQEKYYG